MIKADVVFAQRPARPVSPLIANKGTIVYNADSLGNRIPDFSYCGYMASEEGIPTVPVKIVIPVSKGDATHRIQSALDYVASLPADEKGFRGAVLLQKGTYTVSGQLRITSSGVVLRGSGMAKGGTVLIGAGKDREALIRVFGKNDKLTGAETKLADAYVPVNATTFSVNDVSAFKVGDNILIHRPSTLAWF